MSENESDLAKSMEKFDKLNKKGKLSPQDIEKWDRKHANMREESANLRKKMEKAERESKKLSR